MNCRWIIDRRSCWLPPFAWTRLLSGFLFVRVSACWFRSHLPHSFHVDYKSPMLFFFSFSSPLLLSSSFHLPLSRSFAGSATVEPKRVAFAFLLLFTSPAAFLHLPPPALFFRTASNSEECEKHCGEGSNQSPSLPFFYWSKLLNLLSVCQTPKTYTLLCCLNKMFTFGPLIIFFHQNMSVEPQGK